MEGETVDGASRPGEDRPGPDDYIDPTGPDPAGIPDPLPDELQGSPEVDRALEEVDPMEGEAPSG
jgi:hypothetical protein